jgi:hypothetical protein
MAAKSFVTTAPTASAVYMTARRLTDRWLLDDADGAFRAVPANPYVLLAEAAVECGVFEHSEGRLPWADGRYRIVFYKQNGAAPAPVDDAPPLTAVEVVLLGDMVFDVYPMASYAAASRSLLLRILKAQKSTDGTVAGLAGQIKVTNSQAVSLDKGQRRAERN